MPNDRIVLLHLQVLSLLLIILPRVASAQTSVPRFEVGPLFTVPLSKREIRQRSSELNALVYESDPIGVAPDGPRDEYECLVGPVLTMLQSGATQGEIAAYLDTELVEHFGLVPNRDNIAAAVSRIRACLIAAGRILLIRFLWRYLMKVLKCGVPFRHALSVMTSIESSVSRLTSAMRRGSFHRVQREM